jgi:hypothetical protein
MHGIKPVKHKLQHWLSHVLATEPHRSGLHAHPWLQPISQRLRDRQLWRMQHESVARGVAIGAFWAFALPVGQIVVATAHCAWWRGNIPVAAAMTLITNPLTVGFWLWLAYQVGALLMGTPLDLNGPKDTKILELISEVGWPIVVGMGAFAIGGAALGYLGTKVIWRLRVAIRRRRA